MKKLHMGQNLLIAALAVLTAFCAFISILSLLPANTGVEIREEFRVSTSRLNAVNDGDGLYLVEFNGALRNTTDREITVEKLTVSAKSTGAEVPIVFTKETVVIPARTTITVSASMGAKELYNRVGEVTVTLNGETVSLRNPAQTDLGIALVPIALTLIAAFFLVRSCKIRFYMAQEDRADEAAEARKECTEA